MHNNIKSGNEPEDKGDFESDQDEEDFAAMEEVHSMGNNEEYVTMYMYDNDYYAWDSDSEYMMSLTDYLASEFDRPIGSFLMKVHKVTLNMVSKLLSQPKVKCKDKECLATYVDVNGDKA
ncbi:hypothetical protein C0989_001791 [Termitomyces sp. Mn162]|nr:hypothetical protein C0989_001791 [Termitomyces sp. Mn162]